VIFTTTCSFMREGSAGKKVVEHEWGLPQEARATAGSNSQAERGAKDEEGGQEDGDGEDEEDEGNGLQSHGPFVSRRLGVANSVYYPKPWVRGHWHSIVLIKSPGQTTPHTHTQNAPSNGSAPAAASPPPPVRRRISQPWHTCPTAGSSAPSAACTTSGLLGNPLLPPQPQTTLPQQRNCEPTPPTSTAQQPPRTMRSTKRNDRSA